MKKSSKLIAASFCAVTLLTLTLPVITTEADTGSVSLEMSLVNKGNWEKDDRGWKFKSDKDGYLADEWESLYWDCEANWYYFDEEGYMKTGWFEWDGETYYLNPTTEVKGAAVTGWHEIDGEQYYFVEEFDGPRGSLSGEKQ